MFNPDKVSKEWYSLFNSTAGAFSNAEFLDFYGKMDIILDRNFQECETVPCKNFIITPPAGSLIAFSAINKKYNSASVGRENAFIIAKGVMEYWAKAIKPGQPCVCKKVVSVKNDAMVYITPLANDILKLKSTRLHNGYLDLATVIYNNIMKINWAIGEASSNCNTVVTGKII